MTTYEFELFATGFESRSRSLPRWSDERPLEREKMPEVLLVEFEFCEDWPLGTVAVVEELPPPPPLLDPLVVTVGGAGEGDLLGTLIKQCTRGNACKPFQESYARTITCKYYEYIVIYLMYSKKST